MTNDIISPQPEVILLDISHNYCGTGILPVQNLLFSRCLLVICYIKSALHRPVFISLFSSSAFSAFSAV
ncbi:hypothetical protein QUB12_37420 [Microcoleus sp. B7-D4]